MVKFKLHELLLFNNTHVTCIFRVVMLLSVCVVVLLGKQLVSWSIIEAAEVDLTFQTKIKRP